MNRIAELNSKIEFWNREIAQREVHLAALRATPRIRKATIQCGEDIQGVNKQQLAACEAALAAELVRL